MSPSDTAAYLGLSIALGILVGLWARAWGRSGLRWGVGTTILTPFGFWLVVLMLILRGRRRRDAG